MRNKLIFRIFLTRLARYLLLPAALCVVLFPLYGILHQQTITAHLSDTAEQLSSSVGTLEHILYDIRFVTNKLFHDTNFNTLTISQDDDTIADDATVRTASDLLDELTYNLSPVSYCYVTFCRNHLVIDTNRVYRSYESFYPGTLEYEGISLEQWSAQRSSQDMICLPVQPVYLYQTSYPDSYLTVTQPFFDANNRYMGSCTMLLQENHLVDLFLPLEEWRGSGLFYIAREDGTFLQRYHYDDEPLTDIQDGSTLNYNGVDYILVTKQIPELRSVVVVGLPYAMYAQSLQPIHLAIWFYIWAGLLACLVLSSVMTWLDMRYLRPTIDTLEQKDNLSNRLLRRMVLQKLQSHKQLSAELDRTRGQILHSWMETLLKTGYVNSSADHQLVEALALTEFNHLLMIPAPREPMGPGEQELRIMLVEEQLAACFGKLPFIHSAADGSMLAVLSLDSDDPGTVDHLRQRIESLRDRLALNQNMLLSARFSRLEQISSAYWQLRNAAVQAEEDVSVYCLSNQIWENAPVPELIMLERLQETLLAGLPENARALVLQMFGRDDLTPEDFQQIYYSIRGVLLRVADRVSCEDIRNLCTCDLTMPMKCQIESLCECCVIIGLHVDSTKQSHNTKLQQGILQWLEENFHRRDLNLALVADHFGISKKYVSQFLKDQTGSSYSEYVEELRLNHAMELLQNSDLNINEIAESCGFSSQNTFYKAFRRRYDISPSAVRRGAAQP